jgi:queuine tRNA-ribosyltransferase
MSYGADVLVCLDDCTNADDGEDVQRESVRRTIAWAKRCKAEFEKLAESQEQKAKSAQRVNQSTNQPANRPLLFAVIQGGGSRALRKQCAEALLEIGFDGFGYGGWPLDSSGNLLMEIVSYTRELVPREIPMHALGIGHPHNVVACVGMGYEIFDCAMPTRDARHGRLYAFNDDPTQLSFDDKWFSYVYVADDKFLKTNQPVSEFCDCPACQRYSRGYLHHLYHIKDAAFLRLATLHNLRFMAQLVARLAKK